MQSNVKPIYVPRFLDAARDHLREASSASLSDVLALLSEFAEAHGQPQLPAGLVADLWMLQQTGHARPTRCRVTPPLVLVVDKTNTGRLARLQMEWVEGDGCSGSLYPGREMAGSSDDLRQRYGILTDASWDEALNAALNHAKERGFEIPYSADVRWRVELVNEDDAYACESISTANIDPWPPGALLHGRSAGAAFLIGLVYLGQRSRECTAIETETRSKVISLLPLLVLPTLQESGPLLELGDAERPKIKALERHLAHLTLIFPESHGEGLPRGAVLVADVAKLVEHVVKWIKSDSVPDTIPPSLRAAHYVGSGKVDALVNSLRQPGVVVVHGPAGIGKTAFALEAARRLVGNEGAFPDGRLYIDLYKTAQSGSELRLATMTEIVTGLGGKAADEVPKIEAQARNLLARRDVLIVFEGAENVPQASISDMLGLFGGHAHVAWLTRRAADCKEPGLAGCPVHKVSELSLDDSLDLLRYHADLDGNDLDESARTALVSIAHDAEFTPQFLVWAGCAIDHNASATPALIAAEIHNDPLTEIADPRQRRAANTRRFLERSLARVQSTDDCPALNATARRLFAALAAFDPSHGAPRSLWPIASGLDTSKPPERREFDAARRELLSLRLVRLDDSRNAHAIHALASGLSVALWREQTAEMRADAIAALCRAATVSLKAPLPSRWYCNAGWIAERIALAKHYAHWLKEVAMVVATRTLPEADEVRQAWVTFLEKYAAPQPILSLKEAAWLAVRQHFQQQLAANPHVTEFQRGLSVSLDKLGKIYRESHNWVKARQIFSKAKNLDKNAASTNPNEPLLKLPLAISLVRLGNVQLELNNLDGAEANLTEAKAIGMVLKRTDSSNYEFQRVLSTALMGLGNVQMARHHWSDAEAAFSEAAQINHLLTTNNHAKADLWRANVIGLQRLGDARVAQENWNGARDTFALAVIMTRKLAEILTELPDFKTMLAVSLQRLCDVLMQQEDWETAEHTIRESIDISENVAADYSDWEDNQVALALSWDKLGTICRQSQHWEPGRKAFTRAKDIYKKLTLAHPEVPKFRISLSKVWASLAEIFVELESGAEAVEAMSQALVASESLITGSPADVEVHGEIVLRAICVCDLVKRVENGERANILWGRVAPRLTHIVNLFLGADGELTELQKVLITFARQNGLV